MGRVGWLGTAHQEDGPTSSLGHLSMGTEQCAVMLLSAVSLVSSNLKLWSKWFRVGLRISVGDRVAPVSRGTKGSDRERWLTDIQCN